MSAERKGWGMAGFSGRALPSLFLPLLLSGACNLAIGLEKENLPEKPVVRCTTNVDCDDGHGCTQDQCELPQGECTHYMMAAGSVCREKLDTNFCDIGEETCDGTSLDCPEDSFAPDTTECRPAAGQCDEPEYCTGTDPECPEDTFSGTDKVCDDEVDCTHDDMCDGLGECQGINGLYGVSQASVGPWGMFNCALFSSGELRCWGNNNYGQLGDGTDEHKYIPTPAVGLPSDDAVVQLASGGRHVNVLLESGKIMAWGLGDTGQLGNAEGGENYEVHSPVDVVWSLGDVAYGWRYVASGYLFNCAIQDDDAVWCWGRNDMGQLGTGTFDNSWVPVPVAGVGGVSTMTSGSYHVCAIDPAGVLWCWGRNDRGQLGIAVTGDPVTLPTLVEGISDTVIDVALGVLHTCALLQSGEVWCWGTNEYGELGNESEVDSNVPVQVSNLPTTVQDIDSEYEHTCALLDGGEMMCWGHNEEGQIGEDTLGEILRQPVSVSGLPEGSVVVLLALGAHHTCVLLEDTTLWCWGHNAMGELGLGSAEMANSPVPIEVHCEESMVATR